MLFYISSANHNYKKKSFLGMYSKHKIKDTSTHRDMFLSHNLRGKNAKYNETIEWMQDFHHLALDPSKRESSIQVFKYWVVVVTLHTGKHTLFLQGDTDMTTSHHWPRRKMSQWTWISPHHRPPTPQHFHYAPRAAGQSMQARRCTKRLSKVCPESRERWPSLSQVHSKHRHSIDSHLGKIAMHHSSIKTTNIHRQHRRGRYK